MGIQNLLPFVKKACRQGNVREIAGHSVAVDVSCLLHRGLFGCASALAQGQQTDFYVKYVKKYVNFLLSIGCHVILVFDGKPLPAKKNTNDARRERRDFNKRKGDQLLSEGKANEAYGFFKRSTTITAEVVERTIEALKGLDMVDILVAPYESDAQLTFLTKTNKAYAVITEDSDLIAFGCERIIFKLDHKDGSCTIYERDKLSKCFQGTFANNFDFTKFRRICILAGCDYLQSGLPGIGLNKATTFFSKASGWDLRQVLPRLPRYLNMKSVKVRKEFVEDFIRAENTFLYQIVFDTSERRQRPLNDYPVLMANGKVTDCDEDDFVGITMTDDANCVDYSYAGEIQPSTLAFRLALGNSLQNGSLATDKFVLSDEPPEWSIWSQQFKSGAQRMIMKKSKEGTVCGAFTLSSSIRKNENSSITTERNVIDANNSDILAETVMSKNSDIKYLDDDDDFISAIKSFSQASKDGCSTFIRSSERPEKTKRSLGRRIKSIGASPHGNGARKNWNCEELLEMYKMDGDLSNLDSSSTLYQEPLDCSKRQQVLKRSSFALDSQDSYTTEKRPKIVDIGDAACSLADAKLDISDINVKNNNVDADKLDNSEYSNSRRTKADEVERKAILSERSDSKNATSCYFVNRGGVRTSGLSRRVSNPFRKILVKREDSSSFNENEKSQEQCAVTMVEKKSSGVLLNVGNTSYRASGLRRIVVKEQ